MVWTILGISQEMISNPHMLRVNLSIKLPRTKIITVITLSDETWYETFEPDYTTCELLIRAVGYDIDELDLIGHCLLLQISSFNEKSDWWRTNHRSYMGDFGMSALSKGRREHTKKLVDLQTIKWK